jgi:hypothetical protein
LLIVPGGQYQVMICTVVGHDLAGRAQPGVMGQVLPLVALEFRVVVVRRVLRPEQQYQLKRFEVHTPLWQAGRRFSRRPAGR